MFPFLEPPAPLQLGPLRVSIFALLVIAAVLTGHFHFLARTRKQGIAHSLAAGMSLWAYVCGFAGSHLLKLAYDPRIVQARGWSVLWDVYNGMSSFGGLLGALGGMLLFFRFHTVDPLIRARMIDAGAYVFPFGWIFGRLGCTLVHDHPGIASNSLLAVAFPAGPRFDLGLLELLFIVFGIVPAFVWLDRRPRAPGFYPGVFLSVYGVFRILLDQLHESPPRYLGIPMDQWAAAAAIALGVWFLRRAYSRTATVSPG